MQIDTDSIFICTSEESPERMNLEGKTEIAGEETKEKGGKEEETGRESRMSESGRSMTIGTITRGRGGENREVIKERSQGGSKESLDRKNQRSNMFKSHSIRLKMRKIT